MGGFSRSKTEEYRLLDKKLPFGDVAFWVRDRKNARNSGFVSRMINDNVNRFPLGFAAGLAVSDALRAPAFDDADGGWELHVRVTKDGSADAGTKMFDNGMAAAKAACDLAISSAPPLD